MKNIGPKVLSNTTIQIIGRLLQAGLGIFTTAILAAIFGTQGYRDYSLMITYSAFFGAFTDLGLIRILVREVSQVLPKNKKEEKIFKTKAKKIIGTGLSLNVSFTFFILIFFALFILFSGYETNLKIAITIGLLGEAFASLRMAETILRVRMKIRQATLSLLLTSIFTFITVIFLKFTGNANIILFSLGWTFSRILSYVVIFGLANKELFLFPLKIKLSLALKMLKEGWPYGLAVILGMIYFKIDVLMIDKIAGKEQTSFYSAAYKFVDIILAVPSFFITASMPVLSQRFKLHPQKFKTAYQRSINFLLLASLPISTIFVMTAPLIIQITFPSEFGEATYILKILAFTFPFVFLTHLLGALLVILKRNYAYLIMSAFGAILNIIINIILIPKLMAPGAAIATLITEMAIFIFALILVLQKLHIYPNLKKAGKTIVATIIAGLAMYIVNYLIKNIYFMPTNSLVAEKTELLIKILVITATGCLIYALSNLFLKTIKLEEIKTLLKKNQ